MGISDIINKPVLQEVIPPAQFSNLNDYVSATPGASPAFTATESSALSPSEMLNDLTSSYSSEIAEYENLYNELYVPDTAVAADQTTISLNFLSNSLSAFNPNYGYYVNQWDTQNFYSSNFNLNASLASVTSEVSFEMKSMLNNLNENVLNIGGESVTKERYEIEKNYINSNSSLRFKIKGLSSYDAQEIGYCFYNELVNVLLPAGSYSSIQKEVDTIRQTAKTLLTALNYYLVLQGADFTLVRGALINSLMNLVDTAVQQETVALLGALDSAVSAPVYKLLQGMNTNGGVEGCFLFYDMIQKLYSGVATVRAKYLEELYKKEKRLTDSYLHRNSLTDTYTQRVNISKQVKTIQAVLQAIVSLTGNVSDVRGYIVNWLSNSL